MVGYGKDLNLNVIVKFSFSRKVLVVKSFM